MCAHTESHTHMHACADNFSLFCFLSPNITMGKMLKTCGANVEEHFNNLEADKKLPYSIIWPLKPLATFLNI